MKTPVHGASARQHSGEPSSDLGPNDGRNDRLRDPDLAGLDGGIAGLVDRSTQELRRAWRTLHHTGPPLGLSCDLIIRGLADKLQQRAHGGPSRALQRRLRTLAAEFEKGARCFDPDIVLKTGATLVRQWRGHTHTVLVREDGFEYDGQRYRSLTVIAEQITGAPTGAAVGGLAGSGHLWRAELRAGAAGVRTAALLARPSVADRKLDAD
jgi:hypothetical protein